MKNKLRGGFIEEMRGHAEKLQSFNVRLSKNFFIEDIKSDEQKHILIKIIKPLFRDAKKATLYNDGENDHYGPIVTDAIKKKGKLFELSLEAPLFSDDFLPFWSSKDQMRSSVLLENELSNIDFNSLFKMAWDPFVLDNMGAVFPRSAIRRAKESTKENCNIIFLGLAGSDGMTSLALFMSPDKIGDCVQAAVETCQLSESYLLCYSEPVQQG